MLLPEPPRNRAYTRATHHRVWLSSNAAHHHPPRHTPLEHQLCSPRLKRQRSKISPEPAPCPSLPFTLFLPYIRSETLGHPFYRRRRLFSPTTSSTPLQLLVRPIHDSLGLIHYRAIRPALPKPVFAFQLSQPVLCRPIADRPGPSAFAPASATQRPELSASRAAASLR